MLESLGANARAALDHARDCERMADQATDPDTRATFLQIAEKWSRLADSYQFSDRIRHFLEHCGSVRQVSSIFDDVQYPEDGRE